MTTQNSLEDKKEKAIFWLFLVCSQKEVAQSRLLPFTFLAAYRVVMELRAVGEIYSGAQMF